MSCSDNTKNTDIKIATFNSLTNLYTFNPTDELKPNSYNKPFTEFASPVILTDINKTGLLEKEQIWIDNNECVNKFNAITNNNYKKEYQRKWAENKRRENGVEKKEKIKTADEKNYKKEKAREYRANMTEEKHQELLLQKKEAYDNDKQKEYVNRPEVKAKRLADQQKKRNAVKLFNLLPFAT